MKDQLREVTAPSPNRVIAPDEEVEVSVTLPKRRTSRTQKPWTIPPEKYPAKPKQPELRGRWVDCSVCGQRGTTLVKGPLVDGKQTYRCGMHPFAGKTGDPCKSQQAIRFFRAFHPKRAFGAPGPVDEEKREKQRRKRQRQQHLRRFTNYGRTH